MEKAFCKHSKENALLARIGHSISLQKPDVIVPAVTEVPSLQCKYERFVMLVHHLRHQMLTRCSWFMLTMKSCSKITLDIEMVL